MASFLFEKTGIDGLVKITPSCVTDNRGYFLKVFEKEMYRDAGIDMCPYEQIQSLSQKGTIRGLHFQRRHCQDKLVQTLCGAVYDVAVDLRAGSATFGKWQGFYLTAENHQMLYIPKGFAHGFLALEDNTLFSYLCGNRYDPESDGGVRWDDPQIAVDWPLAKVDRLILSDKDAALPTLETFIQQYGALIGENE